MKFKVYKCFKIIITLHLLALYLSEGYSQFFTTGQDPSSIIWEQINTENLQIIYPRELYGEANRLANLFDYSSAYISESLDKKPKKVSVILHNGSVLSNGFVSWAPKRMEFVTTPPQDSYAEDWLEQLTLHEFRHVIQVDKLNQGLTKGLSWIFGQQATGAMVGYLPLWFMEGDAVVTETALSSTGRGRLASFEMKLKALFTENDRKLSYDRLYLGSYKDFIPDYYYSGYYMVAFARLNYDIKFCSKMIDNVAIKPYTICPFYFGLKKNYGISKIELYKETFDTLKYLWIKQINNINYTNYSYISNAESKFYTSYRYPQYINDSTKIVLKNGIDQVNQFVTISKDGHERVIYTPGTLSTDRISAGNNKLTWDEAILDPRWEQRNYSVIKIYDLKTGKVRQLTKRSRYFSPSISNDGSKIVVVEIDIQNNYFLVIINSHNGMVEKRIPSQGNKFLQYPAWTENGKIITTSIDEEGKKIKLYDPEKQEWDNLLFSKNTDIYQPEEWNNYILFRGGYNGIDNIYAIDKKSKNIYQVTSSKYGSFDPSIGMDKKDLLYANYTSNGYKAVLAKLDTSIWVPLPGITDHSVKWYNQLAQQEEKNIQESVIPDKIYTSKQYSRVTHFFNFHSWYPFYFDFNNFDISDLPVPLGFTILSQNKLSTAISSIGYSYESGYHYFHPKITYSGFYPVIEFSGKFGGPSTFLKLYEEIDPPKKISYNKSYFVKTYLPLKFNNNKYTKLIIPQIEYEFNTLYYFDGGYKRGISSFHYKLGVYRYLKSSHRDIEYKWGQIMNFSYTHSPLNQLFGSLISLNSRFYFPGLFPHHSLRLYGGIQKQNPKEFIYYINRVLLPRGYPNYYSEQFWKITFDYAFPLSYPDINFGPFVYIKRIKMNIFYDHGFGYKVIEKAGSENDLNTGLYNSFGFELTTDLNFLRFIFPFESGIRYSYLPLKNSFSIDFLFSVDTDFL